MNALIQTAADVLGVILSPDGMTKDGEIAIDWGGRKVSYKIRVVPDLLEANLFAAFIKFVGYVRGYLVVDRRGASERVQLHLYDGSRIRIDDARKGHRENGLVSPVLYSRAMYELTADGWQACSKTEEIKS